MLNSNRGNPLHLILGSDGGTNQWYVSLITVKVWDEDIGFLSRTLERDDFVGKVVISDEDLKKNINQFDTDTIEDTNLNFVDSISMSNARTSDSKGKRVISYTKSIHKRTNTGPARGTIEFELYIFSEAVQQGANDMFTKIVGKDKGSLSGGIPLKHLQEKLQKIGILLDEAQVEKEFAVIDDGDKTLQEKELREFLKRINVRDVIRDVFKEYMSEEKYMKPDDFLNFWEKFQFEEMLEEDRRSLFKRYGVHSHGKNEILCFDGFQKIMLSRSNAIEKPRAMKLPLSLDSPFSHYHINASHNTFFSSSHLFPFLSKMANFLVLGPIGNP
eukprot:TRINITY_DN12112_c0_g3_i2.p1 TRINITY_DN12112_c0_g3~~TRINITY_DN12112_c0_g3_i2.p1  ORF type:complete len:329 (-),score=72.03 TRINITY_DN12112_c0_g3_i2:187-1173(-)